MAPICRASGCAHRPIEDGLGYCHGCHSRYEQRLAELAELAAECRRRHWRLFAALSDEQAGALSEHAAGNAQIGRPQIGWALGDLLSEAHETALRAINASRVAARPRLQLLPGGGT